MIAKHITLIVAGLAVTSLGLPASFRLRRPWQIPAALATLGGVVATLLGVLLLVVPGFFSR